MNPTAAIALVRDTFREAIARKIFWGLFGLSTLIIVFFLFVMKIDIVAGATASISLFGLRKDLSLRARHPAFRRCR